MGIKTKSSEAPLESVANIANGKNNNKREKKYNNKNANNNNNYTASSETKSDNNNNNNNNNNNKKKRNFNNKNPRQHRKRIPYNPEAYCTPWPPIERLLLLLKSK